jgi:hypothetical protein
MRFLVLARVSIPLLLLGFMGLPHTLSPSPPLPGHLASWVSLAKMRIMTYCTHGDRATTRESPGEQHTSPLPASPGHGS